MSFPGFDLRGGPSITPDIAPVLLAAMGKVAWPAERHFGLATLASNDPGGIPDARGNGQIVLHAVGSNFTRYTLAGGIVYQISTATGGFPSGHEIDAVYQDTTDGRIWFVTRHTSTGVWQLGWVGVDALPITMLGTAATPSGLTSPSLGYGVAMRRAANGSGDMIFWRGAGASAQIETWTCNTTTGVFSAVSFVSMGGRTVFGAISPGTTWFGPGGPYVASDGSVAMASGSSLVSGTNAAAFWVVRAGYSRVVPGSMLSPELVVAANHALRVQHVGFDLVALQGNTVNGIPVNCPRLFRRADFDAFLHRICDVVGLPK